MNLDAIGTEAELKEGGAERDGWLKIEEGQETEIWGICFQSSKITPFAQSHNVEKIIFHHIYILFVKKSWPLLE